jgi:hypothetical protein
MISLVARAAFEQEMRAGMVDWQMHLYGGFALATRLAYPGIYGGVGRQIRAEFGNRNESLRPA